MPADEGGDGRGADFVVFVVFVAFVLLAEVGDEQLQGFGAETLVPKGFGYPIAYGGFALAGREVAVARGSVAYGPTSRLSSLRMIAHVVGLRKTVWMMCRLSSTDWWGAQPARGPTSGSEAYRYKSGASSSCHGRRRRRVEAIIISAENKYFSKYEEKMLFREKLGREDFFLLWREGGFVGGESLGLVYGCEVALRGRVEES